VNLLLDTHLLPWSAIAPDKLPSDARAMVEDRENVVFFSVASLWEVAIRASLNRAGFTVEPHSLRRDLIENDFHELSVTSQHALAITTLPNLHRDPLDRLLIARATVEGLLLLTCDLLIRRYPGPIRAV
jgi:PIN domain nuclease of toxin-antitoxin system